MSKTNLLFIGELITEFSCTRKIHFQCIRWHSFAHKLWVHFEAMFGVYIYFAVLTCKWPPSPRGGRGTLCRWRGPSPPEGSTAQCPGRNSQPGGGFSSSSKKALSFFCLGSWEMKLPKEESISKLDKCRALFKNHLLVAQDLWGQKTTRNSVAVKPAHDSAALSSPC